MQVGVRVVAEAGGEVAGIGTPADVSDWYSFSNGWPSIVPGLVRFGSTALEVWL